MKQAARKRQANLAGYRLGLYDPLSGEVVEFIGRVLLPTERDVIRRAIANYNRRVAKRPEILLSLGAFPIKG